MLKLPSLALLAALAAAFHSSAVADADKPKTGANASSEGGASLGGTGVDPTPGLRLPDETEQRLRLTKKPKPDDASAGASNHRPSLSDEADRQDEEFRKKLKPTR